MEDWKLFVLVMTLIGATLFLTAGVETSVKRNACMQVCGERGVSVCEHERVVCKAVEP